MTDPHAWIATTCHGLADAVEADDLWDADSLCAGWRVRHVVAHVTMAARYTPEQFGAEMAAAGGDFGRLSDTIAERDGELPRAALLAALRDPVLHAWEPPGGGATGALSHAIIHSLDVTVATSRPAVAPDEAVEAVLDSLLAADGRIFGVDPAGLSDGDPAAVRVALLAGRTVPGRAPLARR